MLQLRTEKQRSFLNTLLKYYCEDYAKSPSSRLIQEVCPHGPQLLCLHPQGVCHNPGLLRKVSAVSSALTVLKRACTSRKIQVLLTWVQGLYLLEWCYSDISANPASHTYPPSWQNVKSEIRGRNNKLYVSGEEKVTTGGKYKIFKRHRRKKRVKNGRNQF